VCGAAAWSHAGHTDIWFDKAACTENDDAPDPDPRPNLVRQAMSGGDKITICEGPVGNDPDTVRELFRFVSETGRTLFVPLPGMHSKTFSTVSFQIVSFAAKNVQCPNLPPLRRSTMRS
jgi:hypothetical protein